MRNEMMHRPVVKRTSGVYAGKTKAINWEIRSNRTGSLMKKKFLLFRMRQWCSCNFIRTNEAQANIRNRYSNRLFFKFDGTVCR